MRKLILFFSVICLMIPIVINAQDIPTSFPSAKEINVKVYGNAILIQNGFEYRYKIESLPTSIQNVWSFGIEYSPDVIGGEFPAFNLSPAGWTGGKIVDSNVYDWGCSFPDMIKPRNSISGFRLLSSGLPNIVTFYAWGWVDPPKFPEGMAPEEPLPGEDIFENSFKGKTLGPTAPPADFKPIDFLNYIISLKHEAYKLGWIIQGKDDDKGKKEDEEKGIMKSLDEKLDKAKKKLEKGDTKEAVEKLKSFIHEVEGLYKEDKDEEKDKKEKEDHRHEHITSEGYALLKYNAQYLIEKLGGEKEGKKDKKD
ncbi:MAG: hypothetical protein HZA00_10770 [Nitrospinae bacterium]|nr:hypothetical protein [Nitrospinota bacterium]